MLPNRQVEQVSIQGDRMNRNSRILTNSIIYFISVFSAFLLWISPVQSSATDIGCMVVVSISQPVNWGEGCTVHNICEGGDDIHCEDYSYPSCGGSCTVRICFCGTDVVCTEIGPAVPVEEPPYNVPCGQTVEFTVICKPTSDPLAMACDIEYCASCPGPNPWDDTINDWMNEDWTYMHKVSRTCHCSP